MYMDEEGVTLATELLQEIQKSARRWFIAFIVMIVLEAATVGGFLWYISLPTEEYSIDQDTDMGGYNYAVGGDYTNGETKSDLQEEIDQK